MRKDRNIMDNRRIKNTPVKKEEPVKTETKPIENKRKEYKDYPLPIASFVGYVLFAVLSIYLLISFGNYLIISDELFDASGFEIFYNTVFLSIAAIILLVIALFLLFSVSYHKECRGKGLFTFMIIMCILIPISYIAFRIYVNRNEIYFLEFQMITFTIATIMTILYSIIATLFYKDTYCMDCGLMNTFRLQSSDTTDHGIKQKFHTEGGYTRSSTSTVHTGAYVGGNEIVGTVTTEEYVPKTTVYDGAFKSYTTNKEYRCSHCGNIKNSTYSYEKKVD